MKQNVVMILASGSPRRKALLEQAGLEFEVIVSDMDEVITKTFPEEVVLELSMQKCGAVTEILKESVPNSISNVSGYVTGTDTGILVIGADTVVSLDKKILGKPQDTKDALKMLMSLSGRYHEVYTGVTCKLIK